MATLTRPRSISRSPANPLLNSQIPTPFPIDQLHQDSCQDEQPTILDSNDISPPENFRVASSIDSTAEGISTAVLTDVLPSIAHVQKSCLATLNDLLFGPVGLNPIVPERRHSMPPATRASTSSITETSTRLALQTLLNNFRNHEAQGEMIETRESATDSDLLRELHIRVKAISQSMESRDAALANALVSLSLNLNRISDLQTSTTRPFDQTFVEGSSDLAHAPPSIDTFDTLTRHLSDLQIERLSSSVRPFAPGTSPLVAVEITLLWSRIDSELENVVSMCKERTESLPQFMQDHLPPEYDYDSENPPDYELNGRTSIDDAKSRAGYSPQIMSARSVDEKMRLDLEAVAVAIDRLYLVAPQLHNQRVELKSSKLAEMERASREGMVAISEQDSRTRDKERDIRELEKLLDLLGKASERTLRDQSVLLDSGMQSKMKKIHQKEDAKRRAFVEQLVRHSEAGRIHGQDAALQYKVKDPEALLTLPEFMSEPLPELERQKDLEALLTLPEFVKESIPAHIYPGEGKGNVTDNKSKRDRSLSAPPLAWLRSTSSRASASASNLGSSNVLKGKSKCLQASGFEVVYVAENHENLHHILVFFTITGAKPGAELQAEVLPLQSSGQGDHLVIKCGPHTSLPLLLPTYTTPGKKEVRSQSTHYEIKLATNDSASPFSDINGQPAPLLDATQLSSINPTSFLCASCTLPLIQSSKVGTYRDLPSEHWEELVEAWMCHGDQKLHDHVAKHGKRGFWPSPGQALVGGSYILFEESAMNLNNFHMEGPELQDNWRLSRCLCGAVIGRCQERPTDDGKTTIYRVLKYAVRLLSQGAESLQIPLSAFVVEDMMEFVQAHASYRFVIRDEEDEKPRILIWLFKPRICLSYTTPTSRAIPKSANILAAKVLYKLLVPADIPSDIKSILNKYPGFPQAEFLSYPMSVCRRLAVLLNQSNSAYPQSMQTMTGLEVGWLQRFAKPLGSPLPLELHTHIFSNLQPYDIIQVRQTCKALYIASSQQRVWMDALHRICVENTLFEPSYPVASMSVLELQRASMGPHRWIARSSSKERNSDDVPPHLVTRHLMSAISDLPIVDVHALSVHYLVPGGRYLFLISPVWLVLSDLGSPYSSSREPHSIAAVPVKFYGHYLVHSTPDGMGLRVFLSYQTADYTDDMVSLYIYKIYPESISPQLTQIAYTRTPGSHSHNFYSLSYDRLIFVHGNILTVWDYKANLWARWGIEGEYSQILTTKSTVTLVSSYGVSVWEMPPLLPESSLSMSTYPSVMSPAFELDYPEHDLYHEHHQAPCDWYSGTPQFLYYDVIVYYDVEENSADGDSPTLKINRFEVAINPGGTLKVLKTFEVPSTDYYHFSRNTRICQDKNVSIYFDSNKGCLGTHVADIHDQQLPTFLTPLGYHYINRVSIIADVTFCPATGRVVYCENDRAEGSYSISVLEF